MNRAMKRILVLLMAVLVGVSALGGLLPAVSAEEMERTDAYVLSYDTVVENYAYGDKTYMYVSPFRMRHSYKDPVTGASWEYTYNNEIFQLINTAKLGEPGEGPYASVPVYCTDADTDTSSGAVYRRINLEDSTYHASGAASRLRAVILNTFPYVQDMSVIAENANSWLSGNGFQPVSGLQIGEAMLATQQAIWKITHGEKYGVIDHFTGCGSYDGTEAVYTLNAGESATENTETNIVGLYHYLLSLEGMTPMDDAVSEATFENVYYSAVEADDGSYTITASCDVNTVVGEGDSLTLSAACGGQLQQITLENGGSHSFTFENMPYRQEIKLEINGYQIGGDVYLFDAAGDRTAAQSMVGFDDSRLPVHGEVVASPERILNIYKTTRETDNGKIPLENIEFQIYKVAAMAEIESGQVRPTEDNMASFRTEENLIATVKTDAMGHAVYNFTKNQQPDGVYLIVELFNPATTGEISPFYVVVPGTNEDGNGHVYTINVNPKNVSEAGPEIDKNVTELDNYEDSYGVGDPVTWIIRAQVPAGIRNAKEYAITDTVDYRLTYTQGSPVVKLYTMTGEEVALLPGIHYALTEGQASETSENIDQFSVSLTDAGKQYVAQTLGSWDKTAEIRVYFEAVINTNASMGEDIPNWAHLDYTNATGIRYDDESEEPVVYTGGKQLLKTDADNVPLAGAVFKIARQAAEAELADVHVQKAKLTVGDSILTVVYEDFYTSTDMSGDKVYEVKSDSSGMAVFYGLDYGTYYIVETKAPDGHNLLTEPITVEINETSHLEGNKVTVINTKFALPETGGIGTTVFTVTGAAIMGTAAVLLMLNRKRRV